MFLYEEKLLVLFCHCYGHFRYKNVFFFLLVPFVVFSGYAIVIVNIADAEVVFPAVFGAVPLLGFVLGALIVGIVLIVMFHEVAQQAVFQFQDSF